MSHAVVHGLLVEAVTAGVHNDRTVHKVVHPVRPSLEVQSYIPVCPTRHPVIYILIQNEEFKVINPILKLFKIHNVAK